MPLQVPAVSTYSRCTREILEQILEDRKRRVREVAKTRVHNLVVHSWNFYSDAYDRELHSESVVIAVQNLLYSYIDMVQSIQPGCLTIKVIVSNQQSLNLLVGNLKSLAASVQGALFLEVTRNLREELEKRATLPEIGKSVVKSLILAVISRKFRIKLSLCETDIKNFYAGTTQEITLTISTTSFDCHQLNSGLQKHVAENIPSTSDSSPHHHHQQMVSTLVGNL